MEFMVGVSEVHRVTFTFDKFWGKLNIQVDGLPVVNELQVFSVSLTKT